LEWFNEATENQLADQVNADNEHKASAIDELRLEWGAEYRANINSVTSMFGEMTDSIFAARTPDGRLLGNDPAFLKWAADTALTLNPAVSVVGPGGGVETIDTEIGEIEKLMGNKNSAYWKGPQADAMQKRYLQLIEAKGRL
jgi:hypothetical protein